MKTVRAATRFGVALLPLVLLACASAGGAPDVGADANDRGSDVVDSGSDIVSPPPDASAIGSDVADVGADASDTGVDTGPESCQLVADGDGGGYTAMCHRNADGTSNCTCGGSWGGVPFMGSCTLPAGQSCNDIVGSQYAHCCQR